MAIAILFLVTAAFSAAAQPLNWSDLEGHVIEADIHRDQVNRVRGRNIPIKVHQAWIVALGPGNTVESTMRATVRNPKGTRHAKPVGGVFTVGGPQPVKAHGGGEAMWTFAEGKLTFVRTLPAGAYRLELALARETGAFNCTATAALAREDGQGAIRMKSPFDETEVTVISGKLTASSCKITKKTERLGLPRPY
jgi:hypothetical protein